jgi:hypothetical protein
MNVLPTTYIFPNVHADRRLGILEEYLIKNGHCPKCMAQRLGRVHYEGNATWRQCDLCSNIYVYGIQQ